MNDGYLLLDVGGTFIKAGAASKDGKLIPGLVWSIPVHSTGSKREIMNSLATAVRQGIRSIKEKGAAVAGIGIAIPGPFDYTEGVALMKHKFQSIYGLSVRNMLYDIPEVDADTPISFIHDANAVLLGELMHGNATGYKNAAVITLGTGLGFAHCIDGEIRCSPAGSPNISIYNIPFRDGMLEDYASKRGFLKVYGEISGDTPNGLTVADLGQMASEGDGAALETFAIVGGIIASATHDIFAELQLECLLFGGQISKSFRFMESSVKSLLKEIPSLCVIRTVRHLDEAALYGSLSKFITATESIDE